MRDTHALCATSFAVERSRPRPRWIVRPLARLRAPWWLDRQLAARSVPWRSPAHAARALQLTGDRSRGALARWLERLVEHAERPPARFTISAVVPPCREQVHAALPVILATASRLRSRAPVDARGVARLRALLSDGAGPCYSRADPVALTVALETISQWLDVQD
jgi:hypothetical protein